MDKAQLLAKIRSKPTKIVHTVSELKHLEVERMAKGLMNHTFKVGDTEYNPTQLGWTFVWGTKRRSFGTCRYRPKTIELSKWMLDNTTLTLDRWKNTMLHEIAHLIDYTIRGTSNHDGRWKHIALAIGCNGERTSNADFVENITSKYVMVCDECGTKTASHKKRSRACSCNICNSTMFDRRYILRQVKNY